MKNTKQQKGPAMPLVKVVRNGQITIPKDLRAVLGIREGDFLEIKLNGSNLLIKPKVAIDKNQARERFFQAVDEIRASVKDADPEEIEREIAEAVEAAKKTAAKNLKTRTKK
jgi:AbrB family looped-hinge helix DNA binding protein